MNKSDELILYDKVYEYQESFRKVVLNVLELSNHVDKGMIVGNTDLANKINYKFKLDFETIKQDFSKVDVWFEKYLEAMHEVETCFISGTTISNTSLKEAISIYEQEL